MWESEQRGKLLLNGKKMPFDALARLLGLDIQEVNQVVNRLLEYGVASVDKETSAIMCRRMVKDENLRKIKQENGKCGGNPCLLNQNLTEKNNLVNQTDNQNTEYENEYETEKEVFKEGESEGEKILKTWNEQKIIEHGSIRSVRGLETSLRAALSRHKKPEPIHQAIKNYAFVLKSDEHYWTHKWTLKQFLDRGLDQFVDAADPLENFRKKDQTGSTDGTTNKPDKYAGCYEPAPAE